VVSENHTVQNTNEILCHHLPYGARSNKATEIRTLYGARSNKATEIRTLYGARSNKATEEKRSLKLKRYTATENKKGLKVVYKWLEAEETGKHEARSEEASERSQQQQCI
jgi:hypothetical protein